MKQHRRLFLSYPELMGTIAPKDLYSAISVAHDRGERVVVATVAHTRGSTPQRRGAKMLFFADGQVAGNVGGGGLAGGVLAETRGGNRAGKTASDNLSLTAAEGKE